MVDVAPVGRPVKPTPPGSTRKRGRREGEREFDATYPTQLLARMVRGRSLEDLCERELKLAFCLSSALRLRLERELEDMEGETRGRGKTKTEIEGSRRVSEGWTRKFNTYASATAKLAGQAITWEQVKAKKLGGYSLEELEEMIAAGERADKAGQDAG